jgi:hypothetical protein
MVFRTFPQSLQTNAYLTAAASFLLKVIIPYPQFIQRYTTPYLLKARTVEPEKQTLLVNGSETTFVLMRATCPVHLILLGFIRSIKLK